ncbi:GNAT family N-acetyltransferase [Clostridium thermarum]|uniref:GNAT family N-acetyltransferase n=1 Tax=Clostridium thermarum TaxID=1716543 RepID=UPI0013D410A6|nr:GNAT family N-acetyltransferase [Clostridium thermarum]
MTGLKIEVFQDSFSEKWDKFVLQESINGTFLQTRNFLNYHPKDRFIDNSLIVSKGTSIVAVIPACTVDEEKGKVLCSHPGSTFGGIVLSKYFNDIKHVDALIPELDRYLKENNYRKVVLKNTSQLFSRDNTSLIDYFLFKNDYLSYDELSFYVDYKNYKEDILSNFSAGRRRDYKYSLKNNLVFRKLTTLKEIQGFYDIICENLKKFNSKPVHTLQELIDFKENRLKDIAEFYGVFEEDTLIAGSMVFKFENKVFHTQYLAALQSKLHLFPMNFLDTNLIMTAKEQGFTCFSFGISTENHGKVLNYRLAEFKEGFGTSYSINRTYYKNL